MHLPADQGFDLDGDGDVDNALAFLGPLVNQEWAHSIATGMQIMLVTFDADMQMAFYAGVRDSPPDPTNNVSGMGSFLIPVEQFDVACRSTSAIERVRRATAWSSGAPRSCRCT